MLLSVIFDILDILNSVFAEIPLLKKVFCLLKDPSVDFVLRDSDEMAHFWFTSALVKSLFPQNIKSQRPWVSMFCEKKVA